MMGTLIVKNEGCHKNADPKNPVSDTITPSKCETLGAKVTGLFRVYITKTHGYMKPDFFIASGVGLSPLYCGQFWPIVPAPDDM
jgi:hypothetical protein